MMMSHASSFAQATRFRNGRPSILVVLHQASSSAGRVGQMLRAQGFSLDIRRPPLGDQLPDTLEQHAGVVVFGGPMSANDTDEFVKREIDWIKIPLRENKPFLGICLGAQMLVKHCGGKVETAPCGSAEIGWYPLEATTKGTALLNWPDMAYQFHLEGCHLPKDFELLATNECYANQAFSFGENAWGVQFHGELTQAMMQRWVVKGAKRFDLPNAQKGDAHLKGRLVYDAPLRQWMSEFLDLIFVQNQKAKT